MLVRFRDINDPKTVERVDPWKLDASWSRRDLPADQLVPTIR